MFKMFDLLPKSVPVLEQINQKFYFSIRVRNPLVQP